MNLWRQGPLNRNPYRATAFRLTRVPREVVDRSMVVELVGQTRQTSHADPSAHTVDGHPVSESDLNQAELVVLDPQRRLLEELLEHPLDGVGADRFSDLAREAARLMAGDPTAPLGWTGGKALAEWTTEFGCRFLAQAEPSDPTFGSAELDLVPPWGR